MKGAAAKSCPGGTPIAPLFQKSFVSLFLLLLLRCIACAGNQSFQETLVSFYTAPLSGIAAEKAARHGIDLAKALIHGRSATEQLRSAAGDMLPACVDALKLAPQFGVNLGSKLPEYEPPPRCGRKLRLLFFRQRPDGTATPLREKLQDLGSMRYREYALGGALLKQGHDITFGTFAHVDSIVGNLSSYDAIYTCKEFTYEFTRDVLKPAGVPLVYDYVDHPDWWSMLDNTSAMPYPEIKARMYLWDLLISSNRFMRHAHEQLFPGVQAATVYHQHANYANFARHDRSQPVRVVAIHDTHIPNFDPERLLHVKLQEWAQPRNVTLRIGGYLGHGWDPEEFRDYLTTQDLGDQLGWYMGYSSVDVAVVWPWLEEPSHSCLKPGLRLMFWLSLGVPVIVYPELSYMDWLLQWGYPLVARNEDDAAALLDRLSSDPQLRQSVSELGLEMAAEASNEAIAQQWADTVCHFIDTQAARTDTQAAPTAATLPPGSSVASIAGPAMKQEGPGAKDGSGGGGSGNVGGGSRAPSDPADPAHSAAAARGSGGPSDPADPAHSAAAARLRHKTTRL